MRKLKKGFTIIELVIVIAVIAVLTAVLVPTFISLSRKAKDTLDKNVVTNANIQLAAQESLEGKNRSMSEAVKDVDQIGFHISTVQTNNGNMIVWDQVNDRFVLLDKNGNVVLKDEKTTVPTDKNKLFYPIEKLTDRGEFNFAIYAKLHYEGPTSFTSGTSFDAGETEDIAAITYDFDSDANVLVVTNSQDTVLTVDAPNADFEHVGLCGKIIIEAVEDDTFKDYGKVGYVEVQSGHYVADAGADIKAAYATSSSAKIDKQNGGQIENAYGGAASYTGDNSKGNVELDFNDDKAAVEEQALEDLDHEINPQPADPYAALVAQIEADPLAATAVYASVREGTTTYCFDSIPEAVADARLFIIMLNNDSTSFASFWDGANVVMDLNGHNVTLTGDGLGIVDGAVLTLKDSKGTGSLRTTEIALFGTGTLYIESGDYTLTGDGIWGFGGIVRITGGSFNIGINSGWYDSSLYKVENINGRNYILPR
jgi:prepilin-type N-terminal cleavage/methylation domain-containing protein